MSPVRMLTEREVAVIRDNHGSGTAERLGLYDWGTYVLTLEPFSVERSLSRREAKLPALLHRQKRPRCRSCGKLIEPGERIRLWREYTDETHHTGAIHADSCPR